MGEIERGVVNVRVLNNDVSSVVVLLYDMFLCVCIYRFVYILFGLFGLFFDGGECFLYLEVRCLLLIGEEDISYVVD